MCWVDTLDLVLLESRQDHSYMDRPGCQLSRVVKWPVRPKGVNRLKRKQILPCLLMVGKLGNRVGTREGLGGHGLQRKAVFLCSSNHRNSRRCLGWAVG